MEKKQYSFGDIGETIINKGWEVAIEDVGGYIKKTDSKELAFYVLCYIAENLKAIRELDGLKYIAYQAKEKRLNEYNKEYIKHATDLLRPYAPYISKELYDFIYEKTRKKWYQSIKIEYMEADRGMADVYFDYLMKLEQPTKGCKLYKEWRDAKKKASLSPAT